jgi:hypothetical protein
MSQVISNHEVLTLEEAAGFLRISVEAANDLANRGLIAGRRLHDEWRFLRSALEEWLRGRDHTRSLLDQAGALKDDDSLATVRDLIYANRGRSEADRSEDA